jgi:DNA-binding protein HU-beta
LTGPPINRWLPPSLRGRNVIWAERLPLCLPRPFFHPEDIPMSKKDLIDAVANTADLSKEKATEAVDAMVSHIQKAMQGGGEVRIPGFGVFKVSKRKERVGRNPATKQEIKIPASIVPKFQASKTLKDALN